MTRVHVICEGQTEETFVNEILQPPLSASGIHLYPALIGRPGHKGGNISFDRALRDIRNRLCGDTEAYCTTFFDYYGIHPDFPGRAGANQAWSPREKFEHFRMELGKEILTKLGENPASRFIPYVQMYEFEGLLFTCPHRFSIGIGEPASEQQLREVRDAFATPEHINDSVNTAPSKRVGRISHGYQKPLHGIIAALEIGLSDIRQECRLFDEWLSSLEALED